MTVAIDLAELARLDDAALARLVATRGRAWYAQVVEAAAQAEIRAQQEWQLERHVCKNPMARPLHRSTAREVAVVGGNRSSKTSEALAELAIQLTGVVPESLRGVYPREKLRGPIRARVMCNSLTDTLGPILLPKLDYRQWNGIGEPLDGRGHWGWIPKLLLRNAKWESAWSEKSRTLHVGVSTTTYGTGHELEIRQWSSCQFMSYDQEVSMLAGASIHVIVNDEISPHAHYRENRTRTLDVKGQIITAFTPPDEPGAAHADVAWFFDEVYERGLPGPQKDPTVETLTLWTEANTVLDPAEVAAFAARLTPQQREVRLKGRFIHLAGLVLPEFTSHAATWCVRCVQRAFVEGGTCVTCGSTDTIPYSHVIDPFPIPITWPIVMAADPHPRNATLCGWYTVTPADDVLRIGELAVEGEAGDVARAVFAYESAQHWSPISRLGDPNILTQTNDKVERGWTMQRAFNRVGLPFTLANDSLETGGLDNMRQYLKVDPKTRRPRFQVFATCPQTIHAYGRWVWEDWKRAEGREPKERVSDRHKGWIDPDRYVLNESPTFGGLKMVAAGQGRSMVGARPRGGY